MRVGDPGEQQKTADTEGGAPAPSSKLIWRDVVCDFRIHTRVSCLYTGAPTALGPDYSRCIKRHHNGCIRHACDESAIKVHAVRKPESALLKLILQEASATGKYQAP